MSLASLRDLRMAGGKPEQTIKLVVGAIPKLPAEFPDLITVKDGETPERMDWRAVVGLPLAVFVADGHDALASRAWNAAVQAGAVPVGAAWRHEAVTTDETARPVLGQMWELLCTS